MLEQLGAAGREASTILVAINPAASILPIVEKVMPERVEEVFWRAVALMPKSHPARDRFLEVREVALSAIFLARYDRQVAAALTTQMDQALQSPPRGSIGPVLFAIRAKVEIDPRGALTIIEALPPGGPGSAASDESSPNRSGDVSGGIPRSAMAGCLGHLGRRSRLIVRGAGRPTATPASNRKESLPTRPSETQHEPGRKV